MSDEKLELPKPDMCDDDLSCAPIISIITITLINNL